MKAISLWQPWASLVAEGHKTFETRSWSTNYRGPLLICAAKKWNRDLQASAEALQQINNIVLPEIPLGKGLAIVDLVDCLFIDPTIVRSISKKEKSLGDWRIWRYAWKFENIQKIQPINVRGQQGLFDAPDIVTVS